jgi:ABC-type phosphate transport system substrate-binding protein
MPPDVQAALAEATFTCVEGNISISAPEYMNDIVVGWADSLSYACVEPEPEMTFEVTADPTSMVDAQISSYPATCSPLQTVPLAVDAGVLIYNLPDVGSLNISAQNMAGVLTGSITNWDQLASDNPGYTMPNLPISVYGEADSIALNAVEEFLSLSAVAIEKQFIVEAVTSPNAEQYMTLELGQVAVVPYSYALYLGLYPASIFLKIDSETSEPVIATPDLEGLRSAASQYVVSKSDSGITAKLDPTITPISDLGLEAPNPYQAIYPVNYYTCNDETLVPRAIGRFLLRLDSQGSMGGYNYAPISESLRVESLFSISKGLPTPTPAPTE